MDKVLVTGGLGVIGAYVCRALVGASRLPVIYDIANRTTPVADIADNCTIEHGNISDLPRLIGVIAKHKPVAIAHLAGVTGSYPERLPWSGININLIGTTTVLEAARLSDVPRVVFPSSRQVYGVIAERHRHPTYEPVTEDHPREPPKLYGKLKRACEDVADHYARLYGLDIIALRLGSSFGPGKWGRDEAVSPVMAMIEAAIARQPYSIECGAEQSDDLCYSGEAANGFVAAITSELRPGTFRACNLSTGELISLRQMANVLQDLYPGWRANLGPGLDYRRRGVGNYFLMDIRKAQSEIGFKPRFDFRSAVIDYAGMLGASGNAAP